MRVLMFGLEFPPFVSGGLGVACEGIVRGLIEVGSEVVLVLPRDVPSVPAGLLRIVIAEGSSSARAGTEGEGRRLLLRLRRISTPLKPYMTADTYPGRKDLPATLPLRVAEKCYLPATGMMLRLLERHPDFAVSFSISGSLLEQLRTTSPRALEGFRSLAATGRAEFLAETSHHSLAWLVSQDEFARQVALHRELILGELGVEPRVFRNTELIYSDDLARFVEARGYAGILADGVTTLLGGRSPHYVYRAASPGGLAYLADDFRRLTTSDLYYYMGTKTSSDGKVHAYFSPYDSPYDA